MTLDNLREDPPINGAILETIDAHPSWWNRPKVKTTWYIKKQRRSPKYTVKCITENDNEKDTTWQYGWDMFVDWIAMMEPPQEVMQMICW